MRARATRLSTSLFATMLFASPASATGPIPVPNALAGAWASYKAAFFEDGRIVDNANGRISHSEGQGYGMLIAVAMRDRETFDALWDWTRRVLARDDGLLSWRYEPGRGVTDANNATDGDILVAWALVEAARVWGEPSYARAAADIARAVSRFALVETRFGTLLAPAVFGFSGEDRADGPVVNLSYWVAPAFPALSEVAPEAPWDTVERSGITLLETARFGPLRLPPDWLALAGEPAPAQGFPARFGYDAVRIPLYAAWAGADWLSVLPPFSGMWDRAADIGPFEIDLETSAALGTFGGTGFKAVFALVSCALADVPLDGRLREPAIELYYPTTLHFLSLIAMHERYPQCL